MVFIFIYILIYNKYIRLIKQSIILFIKSMIGIREILQSAISKQHNNQNGINIILCGSIQNSLDQLRRLPSLDQNRLLNHLDGQQFEQIESCYQSSSEEERQRSRELDQSLDSVDQRTLQKRSQDMQIQIFYENNISSFFYNQSRIPQSNNSFLSGSSFNDSPNASTIESIQMVQQIQQFQLEEMDLEQSNQRDQNIEKQLKKIKYMKNIIKKAPIKAEKRYRGDLAYERVMSKRQNTTLQQRAKNWRYLLEEQKQQWNTLAKKLGLISKK